MFRFIVDDEERTKRKLGLLLECMRPALIVADKDWGKD